MQLVHKNSIHLLLTMAACVAAGCTTSRSTKFEATHPNVITLGSVLVDSSKSWVRLIDDGSKLWVSVAVTKPRPPMVSVENLPPEHWPIKVYVTLKSGEIIVGEQPAYPGGVPGILSLGSVTSYNDFHLPARIKGQIREVAVEVDGHPTRFQSIGFQTQPPNEVAAPL